MIDVHCLVHPKFNVHWYAAIHDQLKAEEAINRCYYEYLNVFNSIAEARLKCYQSGDNPFIGFVDSDDLIEPGIFTKILAEFEKGADVVTCNEMMINEQGEIIGPGVLLQPEIYPQWIQDLFPFKNINHHIFCFRRELLNPNYVKDSARKLAETGLNLGDYTYAAVKDIETRKAVLIPEVGYYYRRHKGQVTSWIEGVS